MAKNMAIVENGIVVNVISCSDLAPETDSWKNLGDVPAGIGDSYADGKYYRDGKLLMSDLEMLADMQAALGILGVMV